MKFLLCAVNSKFIHSNAAVRLLREYALAGEPADEDEAQQNKRPEIDIAEFTINNYAEDVLSAIYQKHPDVVLFSCYIWNWEYIKDFLPDLKLVLPKADIWLGGPEVIFHPEQILEQYGQIRGIMLGEGEATFRELVFRLYGENCPPEEIPGLCVREKGEIIRTGQRPPLDMDEVPFIYHTGNIREFQHKILYYESQRGCPFSCAYCLSSIDRNVRFRSPEKVQKELQFFLD